MSLKRAMLLLVPLLPGAAAPAPGMILTNGNIVTMAGDSPATVEAILIRDGKLAATGALSAVKKSARGKPQMVDLKGKTVLPGFIDAHGHIGYVGQNAFMAQLQATAMTIPNFVNNAIQPGLIWTLCLTRNRY